ncbi:hypothetical protein SAMN02745111_00961 [Eubacterium uniforme]|uniref:Uncharacterized protein n=1 Tax=Eubacterium uniforme TaxID=39495 RepID=A0A1T4VHI1_9FIRM|nr:hypothetical protein [Eubacterium uniforme]SKA64412.1 hypothetical protein SAMN02745111_00961 [Eubacterium uniforme]
MYLDGIVFFLVKVVELIFGINVLRNSEKRYNYVAIYYGSISGLMVGYLFRKGIVLCLIVSFIVTLGLLSIRKVVDNGEDIIVLMILVFSYSYIIAKFTLKLLKVDLYEILDTYPSLVGDYLNYDYTLLIAVVISLFVGAIMFVLKGKIIKTICYRCLAFMMILGSFAANTSGDLQITGEWQDFFLPWLNIEYGKNQMIYTHVIVIITVALIIYDLYFAKDNQIYVLDGRGNKRNEEGKII